MYLQKTIMTLINKVESLEVLINEQSVLIAKLSPPNEKNTTRKSTTPAAPRTVPVAAAQPPQRPVRNARTNASLAIAELSKPANKRGGGRVTTTGSPKSDARPDNVVAAATAKISTPQLTTKNDDHKDAPPAPLGTSEINEEDSEDPTPWQTAGRKSKKKTQRLVTVGTGNEIDNLKAAVRMKYIQAWSFHPDTTPEQVRNFLTNIIGSTYVVEKRNIKATTHASFVIGMPEGVYEKVTTPSAWPPRVCFTDWFPVRPRLQRGNERI